MAVGQFIKDFYFTGSVTADLTGLVSQPPRRRLQRGLCFVYWANLLRAAKWVV